MTSTPTARRRSPTNRFAHQVAWVTGGRIVAAVLQAVLLLVAARLMLPADFGHLAAVLGVTTLAQTTADFGVGTFVTRERAADRDSGAIYTALRFMSVTSAVLVVVLAGGLSIAALTVDGVYWLMVPLALWAAGERNADIRLSVAFADGDVHVNVINLLARRVAGLALLGAGVALDLDPVLSFAAATAIAALGSAAFASAYTRTRVSKLAPISTSDLLRRSRPYWIHSVAVQARNLDALIVNTLAGAVQAGFYSSGSRLTSPLRLLPTSIASLLLPHAARRGSSKASLRKIFKGVVVITAVMTVIYGAIFAMTPLLVDVALGSAYSGAVTPIRLILVGLPFAAGVSLLTSTLQGVGLGKQVASTSIATMVVCLVGVAVGAWQEGAAGAALALALTFAFQLLVQVVLAARFYTSLAPTTGTPVREI